MIRSVTYFVRRQSAAAAAATTTACSTPCPVSATCTTSIAIRFQTTEAAAGAAPPPVASLEDLADHMERLAPIMARSLVTEGYYTTPSFLDRSVVTTLRRQAVALRDEGRYEQSWSESIHPTTGTVTRFDKPGVFACEPDGADYDTAPDLITYMSVLISTLPPALNQQLTTITNDTNTDTVASISNQQFNAKLAVTEANSEYPLHVDNSLGVAGGDVRKLTCILYLNPDHDPDRHQGALRVHLLSGNNDNHNNDSDDNDNYVDLQPDTRFVCFWTDEIPHKVLPTGGVPNTSSNNYDRYALTIWLADEDPVRHIHNPSSKFASLRHKAFQ